jgi:gliding motility-associated-like protein
MMNKILFLFIIATVFINTSKAQLKVIVDSTNACNGINDGAISLTITDNVSYKVNWYKSGVLIDSIVTSKNNLSLGIYTVEVIDILDSIFRDTIEIKATISSFDVVTDAKCFGYNGKIIVNPQGGVPNYTGYWNRKIWDANTNSMIVDASWTDTTYTKLNPDTLYFERNYPKGQYLLKIKDDNNCTINKEFEIKEAAQITTIDTISDANCYGAVGVFKIYPQNGVYDYTGYWKRKIWNASLNMLVVDPIWVDSSKTSFNLDTLYFSKTFPKGQYLLKIVDADGCFINKEYEIKEPTSSLSLQETHTNNVCKDSAAAEINVVTYGGVAPYTYSWSDSLTLKIATRTNLKAGIYDVTATDKNGCTIKESIVIEEPFQNLIMIKEIQDVSCRENQDGYIIIKDVENCTAPLSYNWSDNTTNNSIADLLADDYSVTITDANNCSIIDTFTVALNDIDCIIINNVITPDANGKNDTWIIKNIHLYPDCDVKVINRWGKTVFEKTGGYDNTWDATFDGEILDSGDYYYIVNLNIGNYPPYTGPLKVIK